MCNKIEITLLESRRRKVTGWGKKHGDREQIVKKLSNNLCRMLESKFQHGDNRSH